MYSSRSCLILHVSLFQMCPLVEIRAPHMIFVNNQYLPMLGYWIHCVNHTQPTRVPRLIDMYLHRAVLQVHKLRPLGVQYSRSVDSKFVRRLHVRREWLIPTDMLGNIAINSQLLCCSWIQSCIVSSSLQYLQTEHLKAGSSWRFLLNILHRHTMIHRTRERDGEKENWKHTDGCTDGQKDRRTHRDFPELSRKENVKNCLMKWFIFSLSPPLCSVNIGAGIGRGASPQ